MTDKGKWAEGQARQWLDAKSLEYSDFAFHRYPDAKAARGALAPQPSDFLVGARGTPWHLEVKESATLGRLHNSKVRQRGMLKKYWWSGIKPVVVVYVASDKVWIPLFAKDLFAEFGDDPVSYKLAGLPTYPSISSLLESIFHV